MKRKITILMFGLLLAVGWTNGAQAQALPKHKVATDVANVGKMSFQKEEIGRPATYQGIANQGTQQFRAPLRSQNFSVTSPVTHPKSWYQNLDPVTWDGGSQNITEPFTDVDGMMALVERVYRDQDIPGFKYSEPHQCDLPYQTIQHGWNIIGNNYEDVKITTSNHYCDLYAIVLYDGNGDPIKSWDAYNDGTSLPSEWPTTGNWVGDSQGYTYFSNGGTVTIPGTELQNSTGYAYVLAYAFNRSAYGYSTTLRVGNDTWGYNSVNVTATNDLDNTGILTVGCITPPDDPGYTVMLIKLQDDFSLSNIPQYTSTKNELRQFFSTYIKEIDLLTDGMRVHNGEPEAGTVFAYTGDLNKFYYIGKGKMGYLRSLDMDSLDRAPFYSMYEEFSPYVAGGSEDHSDFYERLKHQETYPVVHDCEGVIYMHHYFEMTGSEGDTENRVNSLVIYIPDNRGQSTELQTYDPEHQPTVGMYVIDLYADIEPSTTTGYYTVTVEWFDNLDAITHSEGIDQTYNLYQIMDEDGDGVMDTTCVYTGPNSTWTFDYPVGDPSYYDISYYVVGTPTAATNPDTFFAKSNTDDVTVPGTRDFLGLQWWRYESDYVTKDTKNTEVNYYRNFLAPHALAVQGHAGINAGNVGTEGRTLTLYRNDGTTEIPIFYLDLIMNGNKAYYRIRHVNRQANQQVEPGYNEDTGELETNNNN